MKCKVSTAIIKFYAHEGIRVANKYGGRKHTDNEPDTEVNGKIPTPISFEIIAGVGYFFIPSLGVYAELCIAKAPIQSGLTAKL